MIKVHLINQKKYPVKTKEVETIVKKTAEKAKKIKGSVEIVVTDNKEIKELNRIWRNINKPTDVLAYAWTEEGKIKSENLGQIFISYPKIIAQAREYGYPVKLEFARILVHGLLHLVGFDHIAKKEAEKMFGLQEKIVDKIFN